MSGINKKRIIYGNCKVLSPNDILMFRCDIKKANWYLDRNLAKIIEDNPLTIKLNFEPRGLGNHNKEFGLGKMYNKCVSCGTSEYLTRHHVVPYCYRKFFPLDMKEHKFHDILTLCVDCHGDYERKADELKIELSIKYDSPINGDIINNKELVKYSKISSTLLKSDISNIPKQRINEMKYLIRDKFGYKRLSKNRLTKLSKIKSTLIKKTHGNIVVEKLEDINSFIEMWRKHFIDNVDCNYLPENWRINND